MDTNSYDLLIDVKPYLDSDEDVLWCDKPTKILVFSTADIFTTMFGFVWLSFSIFWTVTAFMATNDADDAVFSIFPVFGLPFVFIGMYLLFFRYVISAIQRKRMIYAITNKRVLIVHTGRKQYVQEYRYTDISNVQMKCDNNDVGSIFFFSGALRYNRNGSSYASTSGVFGIKNTKKVYKILSQCMENKK